MELAGVLRLANALDARHVRHGDGSENSPRLEVVCRTGSWWCGRRILGGRSRGSVAAANMLETVAAVGAGAGFAWFRGRRRIPWDGCRRLEAEKAFFNSRMRVPPSDSRTGRSAFAQEDDEILERVRRYSQG